MQRPARLALGDDVTFHARHLGLRWNMVSRITVHDRPLFFVDEQISGPFRLLRHEHLFHGLRDVGTRMTDRMTVGAPFGRLGRW